MLLVLISLSEIVPKSVFPISAKKCEIFSGILALNYCEFRRFFSRQKLAFLFPAINLRQPRFTAPHSGMSRKSRRKVAELKTFFFGDQRKIGEKNASIGVMTFFFFLEIAFKPEKNDEKIWPKYA